ncbi:MAG: hypothetical protein HY553_03245 [Elusimicrobia bacterium]|nr:hypothetical protein [Elusimicrobiota bacterium]
MSERPVQYFTKEYLAHCRAMTPDQIVGFLEDFRLMHAVRSGGRSRLISLKVPEPLLEAFKAKAQLTGVQYQTQIKRLMEAWLKR